MQPPMPNLLALAMSWSASSWCALRAKVASDFAVTDWSPRVSERECLFKRSDFPGKQNALEEAPKADSIPSVEARQRSKPCQRISGFKGRAADSAMLERHAGQDCSSSSTARHETI